MWDFIGNIKIFECKIIRCILIIIGVFLLSFSPVSGLYLQSCDAECCDTEFWWVQELINEVYN